MLEDRDRLARLLHAADDNRRSPVEVAEYLLAAGVTLPEPEPPAALYEEAARVYCAGMRKDWPDSSEVYLYSRTGLGNLYRAGLLREREDER